MARTSDRVLAYLANYPEGQDDDQIGEALCINRVQINAICRRLAEAGTIHRAKSLASGKIINRLGSQHGTDRPALPPRLHMQLAALPTAQSAIVVRPFVWLTDSHAMRMFGYDGTTNLSEDAVKAAVKQVLDVNGWHTEVHFGHIQGIDIEAMRGDERFVLEAKGEGISEQARGNYFDGALGELLRRMNAPDARYGLALPAHRRFTGLVARFPLWIRQRLSLWFFFVRPTEDGLEVGVFPPDEYHGPL